LARGIISGNRGGFIKLLVQPESRVLLGVHVIGYGATELVHIGQVAMALGAPIDFFLENVFNYPTFAEAYKVAALNATNRIGAANVTA
ncbi:MAG: Si-specific NAD(P)(+) transhydrogenase, partial [Proteobacteria bacterium]